MTTFEAAIRGRIAKLGDDSPAGQGDLGVRALRDVLTLASQMERDASFMTNPGAQHAYQMAATNIRTAIAHRLGVDINTKG